MSAEGNIKYLNSVKHAALWAEYDLLTDMKDKHQKARDIMFLVPNDVERSLYGQFRELLDAQTIARIPLEFGGVAIQRLDNNLINVFFHDEDNILIDYLEDVALADAFNAFESMVTAHSIANTKTDKLLPASRKTRKQNKKR